MDINRNLADPQNVYGSVAALGKQVEHGWEQFKDIKLPDPYHDISSVLVTGMGGSALGARLISSLYSENLNVPIVISNSYNLPGFVDENTLVIASSYSGITEETVASTQEAIKRQAKIVAIATGGELTELENNHGYPLIAIDARHNPCGQPRTAVGYSVTAQLAVLSKAKVITVSDDEIRQVAGFLEKQRDEEAADTNNSLGMRLARKLTGRFPVLVASEHVAGAVWTTKNQFNETAKTFSVLHEIPELNHHLMEGLQFPPSNKDDMLCIFYESDFYHERVKKRFTLTKEAIQKQGIPIETIKLQGSTKIEQAFEVLGLGGYITYYLAMLHHVNPSQIPWVDWFKAELGK